MTHNRPAQTFGGMPIAGAYAPNLGVSGNTGMTTVTGIGISGATVHVAYNGTSYVSNAVSGSTTIYSGGNAYYQTSGNVGSIAERPSEPTIEGTTASIYQVAALVRAGNSVEAIRRDYPMLSDEQIFAAAKYAQNNPALMDKYPSVILADALRQSGLHKIL